MLVNKFFAVIEFCGFAKHTAGSYFIQYKVRGGTIDPPTPGTIDPPTQGDTSCINTLGALINLCAVKTKLCHLVTFSNEVIVN